jgi:hypothetical protein
MSNLILIFLLLFILFWIFFLIDFFSISSLIIRLIENCTLWFFVESYHGLTSVIFLNWFFYFIL